MSPQSFSIPRMLPFPLPKHPGVPRGSLCVMDHHPPYTVRPECGITETSLHTSQCQPSCSTLVSTAGKEWKERTSEGDSGVKTNGYGAYSESQFLPMSQAAENHREWGVSACKSLVSLSNVQCARFSCGLLDPFHSGIHFVPVFSKLPPSSPATRCSKFPRSVPSKASDIGGASISLFLLEIVGLR